MSRSIRDKMDNFTADTLAKKTEIELIWESASPGSGFPAQGLSVIYKKYKFLIIDFRKTYSSEQTITRIVTVGYGECLTYVESATYAMMENYSRSLTFNENSLDFSTAYHKATYSSAVGAANDGYLIPVKIYGVKSAQ